MTSIVVAAPAGFAGDVPLSCDTGTILFITLTCIG